MEIKGNFDRRLSGTLGQGLAGADDAGAVTSWLSPPVRRSALLGFFVVVLLAALGVAAQSVSAAPLFGPKTDFATGGGPMSVATADFNGDGDPDLATANSYSNSPFDPPVNTVSVLLGDGTGGFAPKTDFAAGGASVTTDDFNGDGDPDLAVTYSYGVSVLLGDGTGGFAPKTDFVTGGVSVTTADFNGDGDPDLAVANRLPNTNSVSVLLGDGTGGFAPKNDFATGLGPSSVTADDFNGDGDPDLAVANGDSAVGGNTVSVLLGDGTGGFAPKTDFSAGGSPSSVTTDDFNGDGDPDLAVTNLYYVSVLLGDGTGSFAPKTDFTTGDRPRSVTTDDFNGDGDPDLAVAAGAVGVSVLLGDGTGGFAPKTDFAIGGGSSAVTADDFNADSKPDLAVTSWGSDTVSILLGDGSPELAAAPAGLRFPFQTVGTLSPAKTVTFTSEGYPLLVKRVQMTGADRNEFIISTDDCTGRSLPSPDSCEVALRFAPSAARARAATLEISHDGPTSPLTVPVSGTGQSKAKPGIKRPGKTPVRVKANRVIKVARVKCREGTCQIKKVQVRFNIANRVFNGVGRFQKKIGEGRFAIVKTTMKKRLYRKLKRGRVSGTVTAVVTANSSNGSRNRQAIRTGLKR